MRKIIHHIRRQPEHVRRNILHISTLVSGFILLMIWLYSLSTTFSDPDNQIKMSQDLKPFSALKDNIVDGYSSFSNPDTEQQ